MQSLSGVHERDPRVALIGFTDQEAFGRATTRQPDADEARGKHARVVEHEEVAAPQEPFEVREHRVLDGAAVTLQHQEARPSAFARLLGDERLGQVEVEVGNVHEPKNRPRFTRPLTAFRGFQRSPTFLIRARTLSSRKASMATPFSTSAHVSGVDTDAVDVGRTE